MKEQQIREKEWQSKKVGKKMQHMKIPELLHEMHQYLHLIQKMAV